MSGRPRDGVGNVSAPPRNFAKKGNQNLARGFGRSIRRRRAPADAARRAMPLSMAWLSVGVAAAAIFTMGGVVFGVASLYPVLYYEHVLEASSCADATPRNATVCAAGPRMAEKCCDAQQVEYTLMSSIALFAADGAMLLYGELGDRAGPRACFGTGAVLAWLALGLLALSVHVQSDALWFGAFFSLGCSGPGVFMGCLFLGERY